MPIGSATFSQDFPLPSAQLIHELFKPVTEKPFKQKKFSVEEFEEVFGEGVKASVRYDYLYLTGGRVRCKWDAGEGVLKVSGRYGKMGT